MSKRWLRQLGSIMVATMLALSAIMGDIMPVYADLLIDDSEEDQILSVDNDDELSEDTLVEDSADKKEGLVTDTIESNEARELVSSDKLSDSYSEDKNDMEEGFFELTPDSVGNNPYPTLQRSYNEYYKRELSQIPCTWYAWQHAYDRLGISLPVFGNGYAYDWYNGAQNDTTYKNKVGTTPKANSIACYTGNTWGHVAYVTGVNNDGTMIVDEGGYAPTSYERGGDGTVTNRTVSSVVGNVSDGLKLVGFIYLDLNGTDLGPKDGSGPIIQDGDYQLVSALGENLTLDIMGNDIPAADGTKIDVWTGLNRTGDIFHFEYLGGSRGYYKITQKGTNKALVIGGPSRASGAEDIIWGYYSTNNAFQWTVRGGEDGWFYLQNRYGGYYLDVDNGDENKPSNGKYDGRPVVQKPFDASNSQKWGFVRINSIMGENKGAGQTIPNGNYAIVSALSNDLSLDIVGNDIPAKNGEKLTVWHGINRPGDIFTVTYLGNSYYKIIQKGTNKGVVIGGPDLKLGAKDMVWDYSSSNLGFQWSIVNQNDGYYILQNRCGEYCLDVESADELPPTDGNYNGKYGVIQWTGNGSKSQKWKFVNADAPVFTTSSLPNGTTGKSYSATVAVTSGTGITWNCSGTLPAGLTFSNGKISGTPTKAGTYNITVTAKNTFASSSKTYSIKIDQATVSVTGVSLNKSSASIVAGKTETLTATVAPSNATNKSVTWTSSNTNVATVSNTGVVTARAQGTATITVKTVDGNKTATCKVIVNPAIISVTGVSLNKSSTNIIAGNTESLTATISPSNATNKNVTWTSSNSNVATVTSSGVVTARTEGTADIIVKTADGGKSAVCRVSVVTPPQHVVETYSPDGRVGVPYSFTFESDGTKPLTWEVLDLGSSSYEIPKGLTLSSSGVLSGIPEKAGAYQFYITVSNAYGKYGFYCKTAIIGEKLSFSLDSLPKGKVGEYYDITIQPISDTPYSAYINIEGEDESSIGLRAVNGNGLRICGTPTKAGVFTVVCEGTSYDGHSEKRYDLVIEGNKPVTGVELNKSSTTIVAGNTEALRATVTPYDAADKTVTWTSSNTNVATVNADGLVTAKAEGTADIKVKTNDGGKTATCKVRVVTIPGITTSSLPNGRVGESYTISMTASGTTPITWSIISGSLPSGLILDPDGTIYGAPAAAGIYTFSVQAKNSYGSSPAKQLSININPSKPVPGPGGDEPNGTDTIIVAGQRIDLKEVCFKNVHGSIDRYVVDDRKFASISKTVLSGTKEGKVTVTAQSKIGRNIYEDVAKCQVTILNRPKLKFSKQLTYDGQAINASDYFTTPDTNVLGATYWESSNPSVVEVTDPISGTLVAHKNGTSNISAYFGNKGKNGTLKVSAAVNVKIPSFQKNEYSVQTGADLILAMKNVTKAQNPTWSTENGSVATATAHFDSKGNPTGKVLIKGINYGDTTLIATIDGQKYRCVIHVTAPKISRTALSIKTGRTASLSLQKTKLKKNQIIWKSSNENVAKVDVNGKITGVAPGEAIIYTNAGGIKNECAVTVR